MCIGLYTSRVILNILGPSDYGLFNVVGGSVTMFSFFSTTLSGGTQRFLNIALGSENNEEISKTFNTVFTMHLMLSLIFFIIMLFLGYYIVNKQLNIPEDRSITAIYVLFFCILSTCIDIMIVPFNADIIAHEHMNFYAYISIFEAIIKLVIVFLLQLYPDTDSLKLYSILYATSSAILLLIYYTYCNNKFKECKRVKIYFERKRIANIGTYVSWALLGNLSFMLSTQGINLLFNIYGNTIVNAARGLSVQVSGILTRFSNNITIATNPQIVKRYASGELDSMFLLAKNTSKFCGFLMILLLVPIILEIEFLLRIWLIEVPEHTTWFTIIMIINAFFTAIGVPFHCVLGATGKIRNMQIFTGSIQIAYVAVTYFLLNLGYSIDCVMSLYILPNVLLLLIYLYYIKKYTNLNITSYFKDVFLKIIIVLFITTLLPLFIHLYFKGNDFIRVALVFISTLVSLITVVYFIGIDSNTKNIIHNKLRKYINLFDS